MAQLSRLAALALAAVLAPVAAARAACLHYEPAQVVLVGRLMLMSDHRYLALRLDRPVCVVAGSGHPGAEGVRLVHIDFQLLHATPGLEGWAGRRAAASGSLFHGAHDREGELSLLVSGFGRAR